MLTGGNAWMKSLRLCLLLLLCLLLTGCGRAEDADQTSPSTENTAPTEDTRDTVEQLSIVVTEFDISQLSYYTSLKELDLSGSTCYPQIMEYIRMNPQVQVTYTVELGGTVARNDTTSLVLEKGQFDPDLVLVNLAYLPELTSLSLPDTDLPNETLAALEEAYPELAFTYTITLLGQSYPRDTTHLDLTDITPAQAAQAAPVLGQFTHLQTVNLMNGSGSCQLAVSDVKTLVDAAPGVKFHYSFSLFGKTISTDDETVTYKNVTLTDSGVEELRAALGIMTGCDAFILDGCNLSSEELAAIREDFTNTELAWRINFGRYTCLTNKEDIRAVYHVDDSNVSELKYCRKAKYIDMGHNETLSDLSFVGYMPDLEILIVSGCSVKDLSGFENCKKLEFLELAYCGFLEDLSPLAECESLKYLNISYTKVSNLQPLDGLPLERLFCIHSRVGAEEQKIFQEIHDTCWTHFYAGDNPYGIGWRYDDSRTYSEIYKKIREIWNYDQLDKIVAAQQDAGEG